MKFLLVEDHPIFRIGVQSLLTQRWPGAVCVECGSLELALLALREPPLPSVALLDLNLPDTQGMEGVARLLRAAPSVPVLVLSLNTEMAFAERVLQLGAAGYLPKDEAAADLVRAVERILQGGRYVSADMAEHLIQRAGGQASGPPHESLSEQEYRVMLLLAAGQRVADIGAAMHLSPKTISTYRSRVLEKLGLGSNAELARYCLQHGLRL
jgi:two-component system, NarL family, invasion response regulator UvrY